MAKEVKSTDWQAVITILLDGLTDYYVRRDKLNQLLSAKEVLTENDREILAEIIKTEALLNQPK